MMLKRIGCWVTVAVLVTLGGCVTARGPSGAPYPTGSESPLPRVEQAAVLSQADGVELRGDLYLPGGSTRAPAILLLGPTGPDDRNLSFGPLEPFRALAQHLQAHGTAVLTLDDRGVGGSGGDWTRADYDMLAADALSGLEWLAAHPEVDPSRVGLFGLSEGSAVALVAAARQPERVAFLILGSPPGLSGETALEDQLERTMAATKITGVAADAVRQTFRQFVALTRRASADTGFLPELEAFLAGPGASLIPPYRFVPEAPAARALLFTSPWYQSQLDWDPQPLLAAVRRPTLVIGGELDLILPPALHHPFLATGLDEAHAHFEVVAGVNHLLLPAITGSAAEYRTLERSASPRVLALITGWLESRGFL